MTIMESTTIRDQRRIQYLSETVEDQANLIGNLRAAIVRGQDEKRTLLAALRRIHQNAPAEQPDEMDGMPDEEWGVAVARWEAGEIAREALESVGAPLTGEVV